MKETLTRDIVDEKKYSFWKAKAEAQVGIEETKDYDLIESVDLDITPIICIDSKDATK